jgi:hypothetical protein
MTEQLKASPLERLAEHLTARPLTWGNDDLLHIQDWLEYSLNRCGLVVVEEQSLTRHSPEADALCVRAKELLATYLTGSNVAAASIALQLGGHARTMAEPFFASRDEALAALARTPAQEGE